MVTTIRLVQVWAIVLVALFVNSSLWAASDTEPFARQVDELLAQESVHSDNVARKVERSPATTLADKVNDTTFIRRVYFDLIGVLPSPEEVTRFSLDPALKKRNQLVEKLLGDQRFGENWGRYWRDVIMYRRTEARAEIASSTVVEYLQESLNNGRPWDEIASSFITAKGSVRENGATGLIFAQGGLPEDITSEVSRIFLGIQIQCAQCHDHPTDSWKREEFHKLAAFFPRVAVRPDRSTSDFNFIVSVTDAEMRFRPRNNDNRFFGTLEHFMPDLNDPAAKGTLIQPTFFLTGESLKPGTDDEARRTQLANWITSRNNPWFAKAFVNRIWSELVGEGFYEPVDDLGVDRECSAPQTLELLANGFSQNAYDVKWVYRTITATDAYQRDSRSRRTPNEAPHQATCLQRLRSDPLLDSILSALDIPQATFDQPAGRGGYAPPQLRRNTPRARFTSAFGFDPSERRDEIASSIPQALILMNSPIFNQAVTSSRSVLSRLLAEIQDDESLVVELYLKTFAREPTQTEIKLCLDYVKEVGHRSEAFQDIVWSLLNSTEFLYRK